MSLYKVDLKGFRDRGYRELGGTLERVLWTIRALHERGFWVEVVTLVVPGFNDSDEELRDIAALPRRRLAGHPVARDRLPPGLQDGGPGADVASARCCARPRSAARRGCASSTPATCPAAAQLGEHLLPRLRDLLVERRGFRVLRQPHRADGRCPDCRRVVAGVWG